MKPGGIGPVRILVAEDNEPDVYLVREALSECGIDFELQVADDGEKAIFLLEQIDLDPKLAPPDLMLLDLNLPRANGVDILRRITASRRCSHVPIVVMTSSDWPEERARALRLGALAYFRKPSSLEEFLQLGNVVRQLLENRSRTDTAKQRDAL